MGRRAKPAKAEVEAKPPVARKSRKNEDPRDRDLQKRLADALGQLQTSNRNLAEAREQQTATSEILRVISQSPTDVDPVFRALTTSAIRLARGDYGGISLLQDDVWHLVASQGG